GGNGGAGRGGGREEWAWHGSSRAVAGEESVVCRPPRRNDFCLQQRQDDVTAAEYEGAGAVKGIEICQCRVLRVGCRQRQSYQQRQEEAERSQRNRSADGQRERGVVGRRTIIEERDTDRATQCN